MKKVLSVIVLLVALVVSRDVMAEKVVVVPLSSSSVPAAALPIAWGYLSIEGADCTVINSYGISSCERTSTGNYRVILTSTFSNYPAILVTPFSFAPDDEILSAYSSAAGNTVYVRAIDASNNVIDTNFYLLVFGPTV